MFKTMAEILAQEIAQSLFLLLPEKVAIFFWSQNRNASLVHTI